MLKLGLAMMAAAVVSTAAVADDEQQLGEAGIEPILGLSLAASAVEFQVFSGGCSKAEDFELQVLESNPPQLLLVRNEGDFCEAYLPEGTKLKYELKDYGLDGFPRIRVANPFYNGDE